MEKRNIPQGVFDSPEARRVIKLGHAAACRDLEAKHQPAEGDPNHPQFNNGFLFGYPVAEFLAKQYKG